METREKHNERSRIYYKKNKERVDQKNARWKAAHPGYDHEQYLLNKEKVRLHNKEYNETHKKEKAAYNLKYLNEHPEIRRAQGKRYRAGHKEQESKQRKIYAARKSERIRLYQKQYTKNNPEKNRAKGERRRAKVTGNGGYFTAEQWIDLCNKYDNKCLRCGIDGTRTKQGKLEIDHIIPIT